MDYKKLASILFNDSVKDISYYEEKYPKRNLPEGAFVLRMAPSPTGMFHVGNLYTAFLNRQFVNQSSGIFYVRIEDTDQKREVEGAREVIFNGFENFGITIDESMKHGGEYGPYIQSERKEIYESYVKSLIERGLAYPCFCSEEEIDEIRKNQESAKKRIGYYGHFARCRGLSMEEIITNIENKKSYVIRLKSQGNFDNSHIFHDEIKGDVTYNENDLDIVILKSDGLPTYHFAHAVDDHLMRTTHITRGDEWLASLPIHLELFKLLNFETPKYAHIAPLTKNDNGSIRKLSKRKDPEFAVSFYHEKGIPNNALKLYFSTIGNSNFEQWYLENSDKSYEDFNFTFDKMTTGGTLFDIEKLTSISKIYFSKLKASDLYDDILKYSKTYDSEFAIILEKYKEYSIRILNIEREIDRPRKDIDSYSSIKPLINYMYDELFDTEYNELEKKEFYNFEILEDYINNYYNETDSKEEWFNKIKSLAEKHGFAIDNKLYKENPDAYKGNVSSVAEMIRVAVTGRIQTPDLYEILNILGIERIKARINYFKEYLNK